MKKGKLKFFLIIISMIYLLFSCTTEPEDKKDPEVSISNPNNGDQIAIGSQISITAEASDNEEIKKVEFYINDELFSFDESSPYTFDWYVDVSLGVYSLTAKAYDANDNNATSEPISVEVIDPKIPHDPNPENNDTDIAVSPLLSWNTSNEIDYYEIYFEQNDNPTTKIATVDSNSYQLNNLDELTDYYWKVVAVKETANKRKEIKNKSKKIPLNKDLRAVEQYESNIWNFKTKEIDYYTNPSPANNSTNQDTDLTLSWDFAEEAEYFKIYFSTNSNPGLYADSLYQESYEIQGLMPETQYYWKVVAVINDNSLIKEVLIKTKSKSILKRNEELTSSTWTFQTRAANEEDGFKIYKHLVHTEQPCFVNIMFQVTDMDEVGINHLETSDFEVKEDGQAISPTESAMNIKKKDEVNYSLKTVLMIDNSASVTADLPAIKEAANSLVENITSQQEIAVYSFSENVNLVQDFTNDIGLLTNAVNSIQPGYASTNLYGGVIEGVNRWEDFYDTDEIQQGLMIALTDGSDTQGSYTLNQALDAIDDKKVYMVGLGNEIEPDILQQLGTAGFFNIMEVEDLAEKFIEIQQEVINYANSFYWLNYMSPKREGNHTLTLTIPYNYNTGDNSIIESEFNADEFYGVLPGVYVNVDPNNGAPEGIESYTISDNEQHLIEATTFFGLEDPAYEWNIEDTSIAVFENDPDNNSKIFMSAGGNIGTTTLTITDINNNYSKDIEINVDYGNGILLNATQDNPQGIDDLNLQIENQMQLEASTIILRDDPNYTWELVDSSIATIESENQNAVITALAEGETILIVSDVTNDFEREFPITVNSVPTDGLMAYYPFNGNADDESGNENHGSNNGATLCEDRMGNTASAFDFDGDDDYISVAENNLIEFAPGESFSFSLWQNRTTSRNAALITKGYDLNEVRPWYLSRTNNSKAEIYLRNSSGTGSFGLSSLSDVNDGIWHHVVGIYNATTNELVIAIDGIVEDSLTDVDIDSYGTNSRPLVFGRHNSSNYFNGQLDDVRIYNRVLTEEEIEALYNEGGWDK